MPQATDELRATMNAYFKNGGIDYVGPMKHLRDQGFTYEGGTIWPPIGHVFSKKDWDCIDFLIEEWDYGYKG